MSRTERIEAMIAAAHPGLAERPRYRGFPVPLVQAYRPDGTPDFTVVDGMKALDAGRRRLCGLCGVPLDYWVSFLGGPGSAKARTYTDPPMHPECGEASVQLCCFIANHQLDRRPEDRVKSKVGNVTTPDSFVESRPDEWVLLITRQYEIELRRSGDGGAHALFLPAPAKRTKRWRYHYGEPIEV